MGKNTLAVVLFELAGVLWLLAAFSGKEWMFVPIGLCFMSLGVLYARDKEK